MRISFHGADRDVTGSCHLVECAGKRILIDCGLYQGIRELREDNAEPFGFEPESIDYVLLTHAQLDHCGRLPLLVKRGFRGGIIPASLHLGRSADRGGAVGARQMVGRSPVDAAWARR